MLVTEEALRKVTLLSFVFVCVCVWKRKSKVGYITRVNRMMRQYK